MAGELLSKDVIATIEKLKEALQLYVDIASKDLVDSKSWIRQPNNLISVVAICISILGVIYGFYKDIVETNDKNLQELSNIVSDLTKLDADQITTQLASNAPSHSGCKPRVEPALLLPRSINLCRRSGRA
jgi:hypothetical protein